MKTLVFRNAANTTRVEVQVDIFATNDELLVDGFDTRFTNMQILGNDDAAKVLGIDSKEIENSFQAIKAKAESLGLGLYAVDATYPNQASSNHSTRVTLTGTSGTANVNVNGTDYLATFNGNLETTGEDFGTAHNAALSGEGIIGAQAAGQLIFSATTKGLVVTVTNVTGDLDGTIETISLYQSGDGEMTIVPAV